jgi:hypothetical protein
MVAMEAALIRVEEEQAVQVQVPTVIIHLQQPQGMLQMLLQVVEQEFKDLTAPAMVQTTITLEVVVPVHIRLHQQTGLVATVVRAKL